MCIYVKDILVPTQTHEKVIVYNTTKIKMKYFYTFETIMSHKTLVYSVHHFSLKQTHEIS